MIIQEKDRKKYWCPFVTMNPANENNINSESTRAWRCIASKCMAWRPVSDSAGYCGSAGAPAGQGANESIRQAPIQPHSNYQQQPNLVEQELAEARARAANPQSPYGQSQPREKTILDNIPSKVGIQGNTNNPADLNAPINMDVKTNNPNAAPNYDAAYNEQLSPEDIAIIQQMSKNPKTILDR
jgi:hypothetical protein